MKLKTKEQKHINDNEKRRNALHDKAKIKSTQSGIIKQALSTACLHQGPGKRIVFDDNDIDDDNSNNNKITSNNGKENNKPALFNESGSEEDDNYDIKEKSQFKGKKGFELLKLQGSYGNDERFKIDERFCEDEDNFQDLKKEVENYKNAKQLEVTNDFLHKSSSVDKNRKRVFEMIRYDASNKDHEKCVTKSSTTEEEKSKINKKPKLIKMSENSIVKPKVSQEKFYEVTENIKDSFKKKVDDSGGFSLLQTYGKSTAEISEESQKSEKTNETSGVQLVPLDDKTSSNTIKNGDEMGEGVIAKGIWKETFFYIPDDSRFQEGVTFINKKNSPEAESAAENFDANRKKLREIIRLHNKKILMKKDPFKKKIGGMNRKQLNPMKLKHKQKSNKPFSRKSTKMNPMKKF